MTRWSFTHGEPAGPLRRCAHAALAPRLTSDDLDDAMVVISELVQNVTQHTSGGGELVLITDDSGITIEVRDHSPVLPEVQPPDAHRLGGRGLLLVAGITSAWGVRPGTSGKAVWARLTMPAREPAGAAV
ncbi:ATP-binding protein [Actinoplanes sp. TRM 88003]|uniref:ATP-binding protein n=1 Tax=Paractinoplanes aksuensis TaxID=2939490 RepID=A0ABT1E3C4_9ACTN|nr:ATP-binding protein [Actinoplanes aksuensis]MCO8277632.1 ATP-binding protein [Actinoplanes aksuensis]